jgi:transcription antitermination factor NusG
MSISANDSWFAVYTRPRWEKKISSILEQKGIEYYCPLQKVTRQWSDRKKVILEPVFKTYIFIKISEAKKWDIKRIDGILNYVYWLGKPARIPEEDILTVKKFLSEFSDVQVDQYNVNPQDKVYIEQGVLMNYEGLVLEVFGNKARVKIESMGLQLLATFDKSKLKVVPKKV